MELSRGVKAPLPLRATRTAPVCTPDVDAFFSPHKPCKYVSHTWSQLDPVAHLKTNIYISSPKGYMLLCLSVHFAKKCKRANMPIESKIEKEKKKAFSVWEVLHPSLFLIPVTSSRTAGIELLPWTGGVIGQPKRQSSLLIRWGHSHVAFHPTLKVYHLVCAFNVLTYLLLSQLSETLHCQWFIEKFRFEVWTPMKLPLQIRLC